MALLLFVSTNQVPQLLRDQALLIANQAIMIAQNEIEKSKTPEVATIALDAQNDPVAASLPSVAPIVTSPPVSTPVAPILTTLEIFSPNRKTGLGREYKAYNWDYFNQTNIPDSERPAGFIFPNESNAIHIGLICRKSKESQRNFTVKVEATDSTQNKVMNGTGSFTKILQSDGNKEEVAYYPFTYQFKTSGIHTITFTCDGQSKSVSFDVN